jgi:fumarate hydratase, class I
MNAPVTPPAVPPYHHTPLFPLGPDKTPYRKLDIGGVKVEKVMGKDMLVVSHEAQDPRRPGSVR